MLLATRNRHKVSEIQAIVGEGCRCWPVDALAGAPSIVEDGETFEANALRKSQGIAAWLAAGGAVGEYGWVLADDSGLEVDALGGEPGVHSARFAEGEWAGSGLTVDGANNAKLLRLLEKVPAGARRARFRCVIALTALVEAGGGGKRVGGSWTFAGACEGQIGWAPRGEGGFGYDPLFVPEGFRETFAELGEEVKNRISHRARALAKLGGFWGAARGEE